jgi:hypothetical protein
MRLGLRLVIFAVALYLGFYVRFRNQWIEAASDLERTVIYPEESSWAYYLFRPLAYADQALTGTGSHLGPHR